MSGGRLDYFYGQLEGHAGDFEDMELDELVKDLANLFYDREWYLSGDTCEGSWNESRDAFKKKWFTDSGRKERIEKYLEDIKGNILKSLGMFDGYCKNCEHWVPEDMHDSKYGTCDFSERCLMHRSESCDKFKPKSNDQ